MSASFKNWTVRIILILIILILMIFAEEAGFPIILKNIIGYSSIFIIFRAVFFTEQAISNQHLNTHRWIESAKGDKEKEFICQNFFLPDKIDFDKYLRNQQANNMIQLTGNLSLHSNPSPTFKRELTNKYDRPLDIPDWFLIAYPDVISWLWQNHKNLKYLENKYQSSNTISLELLRELIDIYSSKHSLECSL